MKSVSLLLLGVFLGMGITYLSMRDTGSDPKVNEISAQNQTLDVESVTGDSADDDPFGGDSADQIRSTKYDRLDMKDPVHRDICISLWYLDQGTVVDNLRLRTGHKFKRVGKMHASPTEILEEQLTFMKAFFAESDRMEEARANQ